MAATVAGGALVLAGPVAAFQAVAGADVRDGSAVQRVGSEKPVDPGDAAALVKSKTAEALELVQQIPEQIPEQIDADALIKATGLLEKQVAAIPEILAEAVAPSCRPNSSGFGAVKQFVATAGHELRCRFDVNAVGGVAGRAGISDHPLGLALDMMVNRATGDSMADFLLKNMDRLNIKYIIWKQRINYGSGWQPMEDRGGVTANHFDHVHISFNPR